MDMKGLTGVGNNSTCHPGEGAPTPEPGGRSERSASNEYKIRISYQHPEELQLVLDKLGVDPQRCRVARDQKEKFKRAYVVLKTKDKSLVSAMCI